MNKDVALIACSNGLGHIRRLLTIAYHFSSYGLDCVLYAQSKKCKKILKENKIKNLEIIDFDTNTTILDMKNGFNFAWLEKIKNIEKYKYVISDNLIEVLKLRPDSWITGSFFWHLAIDDLPLKTVEIFNEIVKKFPPNLICSKLFMPPYYYNFKNLKKVGLYSFKKEKKNKFLKKKGLLISCGHGGFLKNKFLKFISTIKASEHVTKIWVEPSLYNRKMPKYIMPATYDSLMYNQVSVAIIRPGIGTITECLQHAIKIFSVIEPGNNEIEFNSKVLSDNNLGYNFSSLNSAFDKVDRFLSNKMEQDLFNQSLNLLDFDGAQQTVEFILNKKV